MAVRWSSENVVAEHRELQANAMALDWRGEYALLAGRRTLALISLDKPSEVVKRVSRTQQKYDVTAAEWNPMQVQGHTFVLASGERAEICQWSEGTLNGMTSLKAHTRTITDLNWHRSDPHLLATCSIDTFVHIWDTRETRKPVASLSSIAGASQVKWNKLNSNFLASGHNCDIRIWDNRKTNQPAQYIAAHLSKIQGLDWSPNHENQLVTASNDCTVKFFDITNPRKAENFINTLSPVWRARYTPFGEGVVTVVVPQLRRGENSLLLWSVSDVSSPVHTFVGHSDVVLEFEWQQGSGSTGHHHLVTWARDHSLRIWKIDQQLQRLCGHDTEEEAILGESTDSEFATEAQVVQAEAEDELEKKSEDTLRESEGGAAAGGEEEEEEPVSVSVEASDPGDNHPSQSSTNQLESHVDECELKPMENAEKVAVTHENSPETGSTTEVCDSQVASIEMQQTSKLAQHTGDLTTDNAAYEAQPGTELSNSKPSPVQGNTPVSGPPSVLPASTTAATQPMSLQQEFSLLNTSQDSSQVNSVEVVAGGFEVLAGGGSRGYSQDLDSMEGRRFHRTRLARVMCEDPVVDERQGFTVFKAVKNPPAWLHGAGVQGRCHPSVVSSVKSVKMCTKDVACTVKSEPGINPEMSDRKHKHNLLTKDLSENSPRDVHCLSEKYLEESDKSATSEELLNKNDLNSDSAHIIKIQSCGEDYVSHKAVDEEVDVCKSVLMKVRVNSKSSQFHSEPQAAEGNKSTVSNLDGLQTGMFEDIKERYDVSKATGVTVRSLTPVDASLEERSGEGCSIKIVKEEVVIHIDSSNMKEVEDAMSPACVSLSTEDELTTSNSTIVESGSKRRILVKQPDTSSPPLTDAKIDALTDAQTVLNAAVMTGSIMLNSSKNTPLQVPAKLILIPETEEQNSEFSEEMCAMLAPQLLENGVLVQGDNLIILGQQAFLTHVELLLVAEETLTQISISPLTDSMESYHKKGVNFVMITRNLDHNLEMAVNTSLPYVKLNIDNNIAGKKTSAQNAPHSDEPGIFQCDKCDKTYRVRSSLNSHKVTHNAEKMYKCDECDKAFHYSTPLQIHKRTHSDERPYKCQSCSATFRSRTNLKYHERLHTGERPIGCRECGRGFKDYTSLKRHRLKVHNLLNVKCELCKLECGTIKNLTSHLWKSHDMVYVDKVIFCEKCGEPQANQKAYNAHKASHKQADKTSQVVQKRLTDYIHRCGLCDMLCQTKPQMLIHMQVHAAVNRFQCKYCKNAYMYRFILAEHVRTEHPDEPPWFCQHCDGIFETCRKMNNHSCRAIRGEYFCPHCKFQTDIRHRLFRHIVKAHPEDKTPYYCDFCKNSYEDPNKLRYHQKREHPDKMLMFSMYRESSRQVSAQIDKSNSSNIDMSQVEMTIEDDTIIYNIPEGLRNDEVFKERVKFKCYYCEAKFPVKNSVTRHILRAHPDEKAYKCLICNIFLKSNIESKNHNRKYHRYSKTGGRDPLRNEKAMKKKAQMFELKHAEGSELKSIYKFCCRYCSMSYKCKRPLIVHYRKWHPDEECDYLPDKPVPSASLSSKKKRKLMFFHCSFDKDCQMHFDDMKLLTEHLLHAHNVRSEDASKYVSKKVVVEVARRGRLPRNAIDADGSSGSGYKRPGKKLRVKTDTDDEEDVDDPLHFDNESESKLQLLSRVSVEREQFCQSYTDDLKKSREVLLQLPEEQSPSYVSSKVKRKVEKIDSVRDVKMMLYRCRRCDLSFPTKSQYRGHSSQYSDVDCRDFLHMNIKQEPAVEEEESEENSDFDEYVGCIQLEDEEEEFREETETGKQKKYKKSRKLPENEEPKEKTFIKIETHSLMDDKCVDIHITTIDEDKSEDVLKILTINASEVGQPKVQIKAEKIPSDAVSFNARLATGATKTGSGVEGASSHLSTEKGKDAADPGTVEAGKRKCRQGAVEKLKTRPQQKKPVTSKKRGRPMRDNSSRLPEKAQCVHCKLIFKTRAELSFHMRFDH